MAFKFHQGLYKVKNPHKYIGDPTKVRYMSSWELHCHQYFDNNESVIKWGSEQVAIPYFNPVKRKMSRYYPDYYVQYINPQNEVVTEIVELKPLEQTKAPKKNPKRKYWMFEQATFAVNAAKWQAAQQFCKALNIQFRIITERSAYR